MEEINVPPQSPSHIEKEILISSAVFVGGILVGFLLGAYGAEVIVKDNKKETAWKEAEEINQEPPVVSVATGNISTTTNNIKAGLSSAAGKKKSSNLPFSAPSVTSSYTGPFVHVIAPNGAERICLGSTYRIQWNSRGVDAIVLSVRNRYKYDSDYPLGVYRATSTASKFTGGGLYEWRVGESGGGVPVPVGGSYEIFIKGVKGSEIYTDTSDKVFSLRQC